MIVTFLIIIFVLPWLIAGIDWIFRRIPCWSEDTSDGFFNVGVLPDFLGGAVGIIAGFFMEYYFFDKLKLLKQYRALLALLEFEFSNILSNLYEQEDKDEPYYRNIPNVASSNIILSTENSSTIYNLPLFFGGQRGIIYKLLQDIYRYVNKYEELVNIPYGHDKVDNDNNNEADERIDIAIDDNISGIKKSIKLFAAKTGLVNICNMIDERKDRGEDIEGYSATRKA